MQTQQNVTNPVLLSAMRKLKEELDGTNVSDWIQNMREAQEEKPLSKWSLFSLLYNKNDKLNQDEWYALLDEAGVPTEPVFASAKESLKFKYDEIRGKGAFDKAVATYPREQNVPRIVFCQRVEEMWDMFVSHDEMLAFADACGVPAFTPLEEAVVEAVTARRGAEPSPCGVPAVLH